MKVHLTEQELALIIAAGISSDDSPFTVNGEVKEAAVDISENGVTVEITFVDPRDEPG